MALKVGELVAFLRLDKDDYDRGRHRAEAEAHTTGRKISRGLKVDVDSSGIDRWAQKVRDVGTLYGASVGPLKEYGTRVAGLAVKAGAASAAIGGGVGLAGATLSLLGSIVSIGGALPAAIAGVAGYKASLAVLKVATLGVADALKEKLGDELEKLSPRAQRFVDEFGKVTPAIVAAKNAIQDNFFEGLDRQIRPLADRYLPMLSDQGRRLAGVFGGGVQILARDALDPRTFGAVATIMRQTNAGAVGLVGSLRGLVPVLAQVVAAGAPFFRKMLVDAGGLIQRIKGQLAGAVSNGAISDVIGGGIRAAKDLIGLLANIVAIFFRVQEAASAAFGTNVLGLLRNVTGGVREFLGTKEGMAAVVGVFRTFAPVLGMIGQTVGLILPELLPLLPVVRDLALAFLTGLGPVIPVLGRLVATVGRALASVLPAISGLAVALGGALIEAVQTLAPQLPELAASLASLLGPTGALTVLITSLLPLIPSLAATLVFLATVVATVVSAVVRFAATVPGGTQALTALLAAAAVGKVASLVGLGPLFAQLAGFVLRGSFTIMAAAVRMAASWIVAMGPVGWAIAAIVALVALIIWKWDTVKRATLAVWDWVSGKVAGAARTMVGIFTRWTLLGIILSHWEQIKVGVVRKSGELVGFVRSIPDRIKGALGNLGLLLWKAGESIISGLIDGIKSKIPSMSGVLASITSMIPHLKGPPERDARLLYGNGRLVLGGLVDGIRAEVPSLRATLRDITRAIPADAGALSVQANREAATALAQRGQLGDATAPAGPPLVELGDVHVFIGDQEITDMIRVEVAASGRSTASAAYAGAGRRAG